jgi:predicted nucleic acid-binding protein
VNGFLIDTNVFSEFARRQPEDARGDRWAKLSAQAQRRGTPLAILDGFIGATALEHELTVVTRHVRDFAAMDVVVLNPREAGG